VEVCAEGDSGVMDPGWRSGKGVDFRVAVEAGSVWISTTLRLMLMAECVASLNLYLLPWGD
jgi:hypothetical protein